MTADGRRVGWSSLGATAVGLVAAALVIVASWRYGPGATPDSASYLSTAAHVASGDGFVRFDGGAFVQWPPLYPLLFVVPAGLGMPLLQVAAGLNAALLIASAALVGHWFDRNGVSPWLSVAGTAIVVLSVPVLEVSTFVWSEPLFLSLIAAWLVATDRYRSTGSSRDLLAMTALAAAASMARYAGGVLLPLTVLIAMLRGEDLGDRLSRGAKAGVSAVPLALWLARNSLLHGTLTGPRPANPEGVGVNLRLALEVIASWFVPDGLPGARLTALVAAVGLIALLVATLWVAGGGDELRPAVPVVLLWSGYAAFIVAASTAVEFDRLNDRLLSPLVIPTVIAVVLVFDRTRRSVSGLRRAAVTVVVAAAVGSVLSHEGARALQRVNDAWRGGIGVYMGAATTDDPTVRFLRSQGLPGAVLSNRPDLYWLLTEEDARYTPGRDDGDRRLRRFADLAAEERFTYVVWFEPNRPYLFDLDRLRNVVELHQVRSSDVAAVFELGSRER